MNRLTKFSLSGFRSIRRLADFELRPLNVLIGANGAGKSNLLGFFRLLRQLVAGDLQLWIGRQGGASALLHDGPAVTPEIQANLTFESESRRWQYDVRLRHAAADALVFAEERCHVCPLENPNDGRATDLGAGHRETQLDDTMGQTAGIRQLLRWCQVYQFHNTAETARIRQRSQAHDSDALKEDAGNLAAVLYRYRGTQPRIYQRIVETLRQVVPCFADFQLEAEGDSLLLRWRERGTDAVFGPHQASDGTLRMMALTTLLLQPLETFPNVLLLDEPELGLHPAALNVIGGLIRAASRRIQVIVATQSIPLLDQFEVADVVTVSRQGRESVFSRPDPERLREWLEEYSLGELWEKNVLTAGPFA